MILEKLEIQGFKSFADHNQLTFPGFMNNGQRSITGIVGPNGSGKSNIADAIRWVLGEQSMKNLRARDGQDVIFSGSRGEKNMAQVSLHLNNHQKQVDIPYSELTISRRAYKNGENEYLINNTKAKLSDIQMILAKANFGQKTYSVIGQGMVENFLQTGLKERKNFFDEATGIKEFQIKREKSLNKLINSRKNLDQAEIILSEISPRLKTLTRQINKLKKRKELEEELQKLDFDHYTVKWHQNKEYLKKYNQELLKWEDEREKLREERSKKEEKFNQVRENRSRQEELKKLAQAINIEQNGKVELLKELSALKTQKKLKLEFKGQFDISGLEERISKIEKEIKEKINEKEKQDEWISRCELEFKRSKEEKNLIACELEKNEKSIYQEQTSKQKETTHEDLEDKLRELEKLIKKAEKSKTISNIRSYLANIKFNLKNIFESLPNNEKNINKIDELNKNIRINKDKLEKINKDVNKAEVNLKTGQEKKHSIQESIEKLKKELDQTKKKKQEYDRSKEDENIEKIEKKRAEVETRINESTLKIKEIEKRTKEIDAAEEESRKQLGEVQKEISKYQERINNIDIKINNTKTQATKYETRLEDLEQNIRQKNHLSLSDIRVTQTPNIDPERNRKRAETIKRELDLIGGIDPETEKEYLETKEKYDFLKEQSSDLKKAIKKLEEVIKELDLDIKNRFDKEFDRIAKKFEEYFKILFGGGSAQIIKINKDEESVEEKSHIKESATDIYGIDIKANPPGKKVQSLSLLSGGEKALTAIALICAIINNNPAPFVTLDEVDAALDEANSEKLAEILEDLSSKTQFIMITHNRSSMSRAHVLYGATMNDKGISRLLSMKMEN